MKLTITPPSNRKNPSFQYLWLRTVTGFVGGEKHCVECLVAERDPRVNPRCGHLTLNLAGPTLENVPGKPVLYLCGGAWSGYKDNLHMVLVPGKETIVRTAYDGTVITAERATELVIPEVADGFEGRPVKQTSCRNWRFARAWFSPFAAPTSGQLSLL